MNVRWLWILAGAVVLLVVLIVGAAAGGALTYFFLQARPLEAAMAAKPDENDERSGVLVAAVEDGSPAEQAGIRRGDILTAVDGQEIGSHAELLEALAGREPGDTIELAVLHGDERRALQVTLGDREGHVFLGIRSCENSFRMREPGERGFFFWDFSSPGAALITHVVADSPAESAGLQEGDFILAVDGTQLQAGSHLAEIIHARQPGETVRLTVRRPSETDPLEIEVTLGEDPDQEGQAYLGISYFSAPAVPPEGTPLLPAPDWEAPRFKFDLLPLEPKVFELPEGVDQGVIVARVFADSPAEQAGLQKGDLITEIDGSPVEAARQLASAIAGHEPGDEVSLTVYRSGEESATTIVVTLGEHPSREGEAYLGISMASCTFRRWEKPERPDVLFPLLPEDLPGIFQDQEA